MLSGERDVVLLRPRDGHEWGQSPLLESMGVGYLAAVLRAKGARVEIVDNYFENLEEKPLLERLLQWSYPLLGVSISHQYPNMWPLFQILRELKRLRPETLIVAGGQFVSFESKVMLGHRFVDAVAIGEGEEVVVQLYCAVRNGRSLNEVNSLAFLRDEQIVRTPQGPLPDLDALPYPDRDYLEAIYARDRDLVARSWHNISRSRGCYAACSYCSVAAFANLSGGPKWRTRSPGSVIGELCELKARYGIRRVRFTDDEFVGFGPNGERATLDFANAMIAADLDIDFMISMRVDHATETLLRPLRRAGLRMVLLGVEAGNKEDLKLYHKGTRVDQNARGIDTAVACDVDVVLALILFNPWSTMERISESLDLLAHHCGPRVIMEPLVLLNKLNPLSGTAINERFRSSGLQTDLFLVRGPLPEYPFLDPAVACYYKVCDQHFRKHALGIDLAIGAADVRLEGLRHHLPRATFQLHERLMIEVRHEMQRSLLDALIKLAKEPDPVEAAPDIEQVIVEKYIEGCRSLDLATQLLPRRETETAVVPQA